MSKTYRVAFISDVHCPYQDQQAVNLAYNILSDVKPDLMFFGGDIVDCYSVSDFDRDPKRVVAFQDEFDSAIEFLRAFRSLAKAGKYLSGNHEERWERTKNRHPFLASLKDIELANLLKLKQLGIEPLVHGEDHKIGELFYLHGDESGGGGVFPARALYFKEQGNIIFGHYHKAQVFYNRLKDGTSHGSWANPALCSLKQAYVKGTTQWQQGMSLVSYHDGLFRVDQIVFFRTGKNKALYGVWNERLYKA